MDSTNDLSMRTSHAAVPPLAIGARKPQFVAVSDEIGNERAGGDLLGERIAEALVIGPGADASHQGLGGDERGNLKP